MAIGLVNVDLTHDERMLAALRVGPQRMKDELRKSNTATAKVVQHWVRAAAMSGTRFQRSNASAIRGVGTSRAATLRIYPSRSTPGANAAFWGAKPTTKTGWYEGAVNGRPQFPQWVGAEWQVATRGQGPYVINDTLADHLEDIETIYIEGQIQALARAFPGF